MFKPQIQVKETSIVDVVIIAVLFILVPTKVSQQSCKDINTAIIIGTVTVLVVLVLATAGMVILVVALRKWKNRYIYRTIGSCNNIISLYS